MATIMEPPTTDRQLFEQAREGHRRAFDELELRYQPRVEAFVRSRQKGSDSDIDDVVQETFLRCLERLDRFEWQNDDSFFKWLSGIATRVLREAKRPRPERSAGLTFEPPAVQLTQSHSLQREERFERLQRAVDRLPAEYREVVLLVRIEGLPVKEVAHRLGKTPNAVSRLLYRATAKLREVFGDTESLGLPDRTLKRGGGRDDG
jgi:RNA polymerase sigma-70 factor (ECF subfamily)